SDRRERSGAHHRRRRFESGLPHPHRRGRLERHARRDVDLFGRDAPRLRGRAGAARKAVHHAAHRAAAGDDGRSAMMRTKLLTVLALGTLYFGSSAPASAQVFDASPDAGVSDAGSDGAIDDANDGGSAGTDAADDAGDATIVDTGTPDTGDSDAGTP